MAAKSSPQSSSGPGTSSCLRILLIDDSRDMVETMKILLEQFGHEVQTACNAAAGVEAARQFRPAVVLCDLGLPGADGCAVAVALRADPLTAASRLIALSGYSHEADRRRASEAGFDLHITKPVDPDELQRLLVERAGQSS